MRELARVVAALLALLATPSSGLSVAAQTEDEAAEASIGYEYLDSVEIEGALETVLSRPEFAKLRNEPEERDEEETPEWLQTITEWLESWFGADEDEPEEERSEGFWFSGMEALNVVVYGAAALILAVLIAVVVRAVIVSARSRELKAPARPETRVFRSDRAPGELAPGEYWTRALALGDAGDYRKAVREILLAAMSTIERGGLIRFRKGLTNRDYFYAVRGAPRDSFAVIARAFELIYFGRREATAEAYLECRDAFEQGFRLEGTA